MREKAVLLVALLFVLTVGCVLLGSSPSYSQSPAGNYRIKISTDPLVATVEARIPAKNGHIFMAAWGANHLPNGWGTFVDKIVAHDELDHALSIETESNGVWQLSPASSGTIKLNYEVDLAFTQAVWPYGNEQAGWFQNNELFLVSKALFIVSDLSGKRQVTFQIPAAWKVSAPWQALNATTFIADDNNDLIDNSFVAGRHVEYTFHEGDFTLVLALLGRMADSRLLIASTLRKAVRSYIQIFDKTPRSKYLMTVFFAGEADAEAYARSAAFTEHDKPTRNNLIRWGNTLAHEFFHAWNGHAMHAEDYATTQWFSEGFTEYFANLALVQQRLIPKDVFIKKMEQHLGQYVYFRSSPAFDGATIKEAGSKKGRFRLGVYSGGWAVAFCLDLFIRDATHGHKNLADVMRLMYERYGLTGKAYGYEDIVNASSEVAGKDTSGFFAKYVEGKDMLAVQAYLKRIGLDGYTQFYDGEFYIFPSLRVTSSQQALQRSLLTGH